ncbi:beta-L-arabinofuranosidase domain-containing protein [Phaeacidiphilus oryzae]|uniref:beta-L-arabinofuranosidase domain-containing protein n=1 Tax=Phaeacidiphilus oryzae TaxID=348818 RepID=UPI0005615B59|nr:beta-L-arabinofuranosidase domain-containing protein [Phaeacidiphilus oryzae]
MDRRRFLARSLVLAGGAALAGFTGLPAQAAAPRPGLGLVGAGGPCYPANRAPLQREPFLRLPPGSVTPGGWLAEQLRLQLNGLNGRMPEVSDYLGTQTSGWSVPSQTGWEELPYWLRGFGDLGYVTGDSATIEQAKAWIDRILATRQSDGFFGPAALRTSLNGGPDYWPYMPVLDALRTWYEYSGDTRVLDTLTGWLGFLNTLPGSQFSLGWGSARVGDTIDAAYWLYNRTGDSSLLDLVRTMHANSADYTHTIPTWHNVNLAQGFREPAQYGVLAGDPSLRAATYRVHDTVMGAYGGFPGGGFAADENARPGFHDPRQGFETCGIVEYMRSDELLHRMTGDPVWADRCEELALNLLPAAFDPEQKGTHYITSANGVQLDDVAKSHGQFDNAFAMQAYMPGVHQYRCCPHNYGQGWPYYAEEAWLASADGGLCASLYAESTVRAKVADGTEVTFTEHTEYPFGETVDLRLTSPKPLTFPLYLRVPGWCARPSVKLNGRAVQATSTGGYLVLNREWRSGDQLRLTLPMSTAVHRWPANGGAVSVSRGPLAYSLRIDEQWTRFSGTDDWPEYEVRAGSPWNYALQLDPEDPARSLSFSTPAVPPDAANPFTQDTVPARITAKARRIPTWRTDDQNVLAPLQPSPARVPAGTPAQQVTLIPSAAARLRITAFPLAGSGPSATPWAAVDASYSGVDSPQALLMNGAAAVPTDSYDQQLPRFTWWGHTGSAEWVSYTYAEPVTATAVQTYWYDDTGHGACRVPQSWHLDYQAPDGSWHPVPDPSAYGTAKDTFNTTSFAPIRTTALRVVTQLQPTVSAGLLAWRVTTT